MKAEQFCFRSFFWYSKSQSKRHFKGQEKKEEEKEG